MFAITFCARTIRWYLADKSFRWCLTLRHECVVAPSMSARLLDLTTARVTDVFGKHDHIDIDHASIIILHCIALDNACRSILLVRLDIVLTQLFCCCVRSSLWLALYIVSDEQSSVSEQRVGVVEDLRVFLFCSKNFLHIRSFLSTLRCIPGLAHGLVFF